MLDLLALAAKRAAIGLPREERQSLGIPITVLADSRSHPPYPDLENQTNQTLEGIVQNRLVNAAR